MKIARFSFLLIFILFSCAYAVVPPEVLPDSLILQPNPLLADIEPLCIVVSSHNAESNRFNPLLKNIKNRIEADLKKSGIEVIAVPDNNCPPELSELRITIDILHPQNSNRCFLHIQTSLVRNVYIKKDGSFSVKTDVWRIGPDMDNSSLDNLQTISIRIISKQLNAFIHAGLASNRSQKSSDPNTATSKFPTVKSESAKFPYVASKNGKIFHKESCVWAGRLKPDNLVGYETVQAALDDGKKPCKQCKP